MTANKFTPGENKLRVFWKPDEIDALVKEILSYGMGPNNRKIVSVVNEVQAKVLPVARQRVIKARLNLPKSLISALEKGHKQDARELQERVRAPVKVELSMGIMERFCFQAEQLNGSMERLESIEKLLIGFNAKADKLLALFGNIQGADEVSGETVRTRLQRVLIVGCNPDQLNSIVNSHGSSFDIEGIHDPSSDFEDKLAKSDIVIGMTKFMSHTYEKRILKVAADRYFRINGAASSIKTFLNMRLSSTKIAS